MRLTLNIYAKKNMMILIPLSKLGKELKILDKARIVVLETFDQFSSLIMQRWVIFVSS